jgi:SET domain-containing protein
MAKPKSALGEFALRVRKSNTGKGLFADETIPKGAFVIEYTGRVVSQKVADEDTGKYLFEITKKKTIDGNVPSNLARYINHSCRPNCEAKIRQGRILISSVRRIEAGEELSYNYGKEYFNVHIAPKGCRCPKCHS